MAVQAVEDSAYILLTATEAAAMLRVALPTLVDWQNFPGAGPEHLFIDGRMVFRLDALRAWIDGRSPGAAVAGAEPGQQLQHEVEFGRVS